MATVSFHTTSHGDTSAGGGGVPLHDGAEALRAENLALNVRLAAQERELAQCRRALDTALQKAGGWAAMRHRVVLNKSLPHVT